MPHQGNDFPTPVLYFDIEILEKFSFLEATPEQEVCKYTAFSYWKLMWLHWNQ